MTSVSCEISVSLFGLFPYRQRDYPVLHSGSNRTFLRMNIQYYGDFCFKINTKPNGRATEDITIITDVPDKLAFTFKVTLLTVFEITTASVGIPVPLAIMPTFIPAVELIDGSVGFPLVLVAVALCSFHSNLGIKSFILYP